MKKKIIIAATILLAMLSLTYSVYLYISNQRTNNNKNLDSIAEIFNENTLIAEYRIEISSTEEEREIGLMNREFLPYDSGMFFKFSEESISPFWMKDTKIPLDIIFIDKEMKIQEIVEATPCVSDICKLYIPEKPYYYVLEINQGESKTKGMKVGNKINITTSDPSPSGL